MSSSSSHDPPHVCTYKASEYDVTRGVYGAGTSHQYVLPAGMTLPDSAAHDAMRESARKAMGVDDSGRSRIGLSEISCAARVVEPQPLHGSSPSASAEEAAAPLPPPPSSTSAPPPPPSSSSSPDADPQHAARLTDVMRRNMSSSCAPHWDVADATQMQHYTCHYRGPVRDAEGRTRTVRLTRLTGRLASCDGSQSDRDQTHEDIISVVAHRLGGEAAGVNRAAITCDVMTMPMTT